jgi:hypothetical protein
MTHGRIEQNAAQTRASVRLFHDHVKKKCFIHAIGESAREDHQFSRVAPAKSDDDIALAQHSFDVRGFTPLRPPPLRI